MNPARPLASLTQFLPFRLTLLSNSVMNVFADAYRAHGVSTPEWRTMMLLAEYPGISSDELSDKSKIEKSVVSRLVNGLVARRLVARSFDPADKRRSILTLSIKGKGLHEKVKPVADEIEGHLRGALTPEDDAALDRILNQLMQVLERGELMKRVAAGRETP